MFGGMDDEAGTAEDLDIMFDQNYLENDSVVDGQALGQAKKPVAGISCTASIYLLTISQALLKPWKASHLSLWTPQHSSGSIKRRLVGESASEGSSLMSRKISVGMKSRPTFRTTSTYRYSSLVLHHNSLRLRDTIAPMDMAPPTKQIMRMRESAVVDKILNLPGCSSATHNQQILRVLLLATIRCSSKFAFDCSLIYLAIPITSGTARKGVGRE